VYGKEFLNKTMMKNTIFFFSLLTTLYLLTSCKQDPVGPDSPDGFFISAMIDGYKVEYIEGDGNLETWPTTGGSIGTDSCWLGYGNGIVEFDFGSGDLAEGLVVGFENEYIGFCPDEADDFVNLFALGTREVKDEGKKASVIVSYIDPAGVDWESPRVASANNVLELTNRTYVDDDPSFLTVRMDIEGTFSSWVYNDDGDSLRIEDGKFRLFFVPY